MSKEDLIKKYKEKVINEEKRLLKETISRFSKMKNIPTHPSNLFEKKSSKFDKESYEYLRQRYYRLSKITNEDIEERTLSYVFDDYYKQLELFVNHFKEENNPEWEKVKNKYKNMTINEKKKFIEMGYRLDLREEYSQIQNDKSNRSFLFYEHLNFRIDDVKNK